MARTLDRSLAETGVLDFKFKFVPVAACRTRIDSDLHAFRAVFGRCTVANSAFCDRTAAEIFHVGINTCCCCRAKIHSFSPVHIILHLTCHKITSDAAIIRPPRLSSPTTLSYYGSYWKIIGRARAAQVERRAACAAAAAAGRASSASPVPPTPMSSLPSAGLSPTPSAAAARQRRGGGVGSARAATAARRRWWRQHSCGGQRVGRAAAAAAAWRWQRQRGDGGGSAVAAAAASAARRRR